MCGFLTLAVACLNGTTQPSPELEKPSTIRILLLHSFSRDFSPFGVLSSAFQSELARLSAAPLAFYDLSLDMGRVHDEAEEEAFVRFLKERFARRPPAFIAPIGGPAAKFMLRHRQEIFPAAPLMIVGADQRHLEGMSRGPHDSAVPLSFNPTTLIDNIFKVLPDTRQIMVVLGDSPLERFWRRVFDKELDCFRDRAAFIWCDNLPLEQICQKAATLPAHSAILFALMIVDAAGVAHEQDAALAAVHSTARAPLFGVFDTQLGLGIVGGPLLSVQEAGRTSARAALDMLNGHDNHGAPHKPIALSAPVYDWRQLQRWQIGGERLPAGSIVRFRRPSWWTENRYLVLGAVTILILETVLIAGLLRQRARRRRAERNSQSLAGRLLTAHEDEHRRLARELHDDLTQRLARLTIDITRIEKTSSRPSEKQQAVAIREELVRLSEDVHALSYRLHPSMLDDLGLIESIKAECNSFWRRESIPVHLHAADIIRPVPRDVALCLYRVTQEALRNIARHAHANTVYVLLSQVDGGLRLSVNDDGDGFDPQESQNRPSLGHASMRERVHLLGGTLEIQSVRGGGSTICAWVPVNGSAASSAASTASSHKVEDQSMAPDHQPQTGPSA